MSEVKYRPCPSCKGALTGVTARVDSFLCSNCYDMFFIRAYYPEMGRDNIKEEFQKYYDAYHAFIEKRKTQ